MSGTGVCRQENDLVPNDRLNAVRDFNAALLHPRADLSTGMLAIDSSLALRFSADSQHGAHEQITRANSKGDADANIPFSGMVQLLKRLGFQERIKGSHHIFFRDGVAEILNLQPYSAKCKPYQVKQVRNVIINYRLAGEADA